MKKSSLPGVLLVFLIITIPVIYTASIYSSLPYTIPTHFDINGRPNAFGSKDMIWFTTLLLSILSAFVYLLINNLPKIDPKKTAGQSPELFHKLAVILVVFMCALNLVIIYATQNGSFTITNLMLPLIGLLFLVLGNYMHSIKPNYFVGFRLPWTLENEDNWRKTHQLVGKLWVGGGLVITIATLLLPAKPGFIVFISIAIIITIIPTVYSYRYFKKHQ
jgi:uncharacterized membrane protein